MSPPDRLEDLGKIYMILMEIMDSDGFQRINVADDAFINKYLGSDVNLEDLWTDLQFIYEKTNKAFDLAQGESDG